MPIEDPHTGNAADLRRRAEKITLESRVRGPEDLAAGWPGEAQRALQELKVHQVELEMQNEELRRIQVELESVRQRYFDLYDLAPVGYLAISEKGLILEGNFAAATMLGVARNALVMYPFSRFILREDQDIYYIHRKKLFETGKPQAYDQRMVRMDDSRFWAHLTAISAPDPAGNPGRAADGARVSRVVLSDITARKQAEEESERQMSELLRFHNLTVGRELAMIELKKEVNALLRQTGQEDKYQIAE